MFNARTAVLGAIVLVAAAHSQAQSLQPAGWSDSIALAQAPDLNPDPHVVEVNLEARVASLEIVKGVRTDVWTYNGGLPGPLIHARAGDRVIVHFTNKLPKPT